MKKSFLNFILTGFLIFNIFSCKSLENNESNKISTNVSSELNFEPYYHIKGFLCLFYWKNNDDVLKCGLADYYINKPINVLWMRHMQECLPCDLSVMREILMTYYPENVRNEIDVRAVKYPFDSEEEKAPWDCFDYVLNEVNIHPNY